MFGEIDTSQSVNLYKASIVISDEIPGASSTLNFNISSCIIRYFFNFYFTIIIGFYNRIDDLCGGYTIRNTFYQQRFFIQLLNMGAALLPCHHGDLRYNRLHLSWHRLQNRGRDQTFCHAGILWKLELILQNCAAILWWLNQQQYLRHPEPVTSGNFTGKVTGSFLRPS